MRATTAPSASLLPLRALGPLLGTAVLIAPLVAGDVLASSRLAACSGALRRPAARTRTRTRARPRARVHGPTTPQGAMPRVNLVQ